MYPAFLASYDRVCFFNFNEKKKLQPPGKKINLAANKTSERSSHQARRSTDKNANAQTSYPPRTILLNTNLSLNYSHEHEITASNLHFCCLTWAKIDRIKKRPTWLSKTSTRFVCVWVFEVSATSLWRCHFFPNGRERKRREEAMQSRAKAWRRKKRLAFALHFSCSWRENQSSRREELKSIRVEGKQTAND